MLHRHPSAGLGVWPANTTVEANQEMQVLHMLGRPYTATPWRTPWRIEAWPPILHSSDSEWHSITSCLESKGSWNVE